MADLFDSDAPKTESTHRPLADRLRPTSLSDVIGQQKVLGPEAPLTVMLDSGALSSLIFWGPPGVGKTTIARLLADETDLHFVQISAIFSGVPELRKLFESAKDFSKIFLHDAACRISASVWSLKYSVASLLVIP